jgi:hypothetical protein
VVLLKRISRVSNNKAVIIIEKVFHLFFSFIIEREEIQSDKNRKEARMFL